MVVVVLLTLQAQHLAHCIALCTTTTRAQPRAGPTRDLLSIVALHLVVMASMLFLPRWRALELVVQAHPSRLDPEGSCHSKHKRLRIGSGIRDVG